MSFSAYNLIAYSLEILSDRRILLAGYTSALDFGVVRLTPEGAIDNTFGINGTVRTSFGVGQDIGRSLIIQSDGKIIVAGYAEIGTNNYDFAVARYTADGLLDTAFGNGGKISTGIGDPTLAGDYAYKVGLQSDGKIIVSGSSHIGSDPYSYYDFSVVRYLQDGTLDTTFGTNGKATTAVGTAGDFGVCQYIQSNDKILVGGWSESFINGNSVIGFSIVRYLPSGTLDDSFGTGGKVFTPDIGGARDLLVQADGKILMSGSTNATSLSIVRYNEDGSLDSSFGTNGIASIPLVGSEAAASYEAMALQFDGKILVGGWGGYGSSAPDADIDFKLVKFNSDGSLDTSFGINGLLIVDFAGQRDYLFDMKIRDDGVIVAAGFTESGSQTGLAVALIGTQAGDLLDGSNRIDIIFGFDGDDNLQGGAGADELYGGEGDDILSGGSGSDILSGEEGDDLYIVDSMLDILIEDVSGGTDSVSSFISYSVAGMNVENLSLVGANALNASGNDADNILTGNVAANILRGEGGADTLDGGSGADRLFGGSGDDIYIVDNSKDTVTEKSNEGTDTIRTTLRSVSLVNLINVENLTYTGYENASLVGNAGTNLITGSTGNDRIDGNTGADTLVGGAGNDLFIVDNSNDIVVEKSGEGIDTINAFSNYSLSDFCENLTLGGNAAINGTGNALSNIMIGNVAANTLVGNGGDDKLDGGSGNDILEGGEGNDTLIGGQGNDVLTGGSGCDYFRFDKAFGKTNIDAVTDFEAGTDKLVLDGVFFKKIKTVSNLEGSLVVGGAEVRALDRDDYLIFNKDSGALYYDADGNGGKSVPVLFAMVTVVGTTPLSHTDFIIV